MTTFNETITADLYQQEEELRNERRTKTFQNKLELEMQQKARYNESRDTDTRNADLKFEMGVSSPWLYTHAQSASTKGLKQFLERNHKTLTGMCGYKLVLTYEGERGGEYSVNYITEDLTEEVYEAVLKTAQEGSTIAYFGYSKYGALIKLRITTLRPSN